MRNIYVCMYMAAIHKHAFYSGNYKENKNKNKTGKNCQNYIAFNE